MLTTCSRQASWWLARRSERWGTIYSIAQNCHFDDQLHRASLIEHMDACDTKHTPLFFLVADGKAQVLMSGVSAFTKKMGCVCWACARDRKSVLELFGTPDAIRQALATNLFPSAIMGIYIIPGIYIIGGFLTTHVPPTQLDKCNGKFARAQKVELLQNPPRRCPPWSGACL